MYRYLLIDGIYKSEMISIFLNDSGIINLLNKKDCTKAVLSDYLLILRDFHHDHVTGATKSDE